MLHANPLIGSWRHKKTGGVYDYVETIPLRCSTHRELEGLELVVYRSEATEEKHARLKSEFLDGRFEKIAFEGPFESGVEVECVDASTDDPEDIISYRKGDRGIVTRVYGDGLVDVRLGQNFEIKKVAEARWKKV